MALVDPLARLAFGAAGTVVYTLVGITVGRRAASREGQIGIRAFQVWWFGLAILTLFAPLMSGLDHLPQTHGLFTFRLFLLQMLLVLIMLALGGLLYYLLYVYTGKTWVMWPVAAYAILEVSWLMTLISEAHIVAYGPQCPNASFCYETDISGTSASSLLSLSISLPLILATFAYFALYFRVEERVQRMRVGMVAGSLLMWFGSGLVASFVRVSGTNARGEAAQIPLSQATYWTAWISPAISLAAALVIYWAYRLKPKTQGGPTSPGPPAAQEGEADPGMFDTGMQRLPPPSRPSHARPHGRRSSGLARAGLP